MCELADGLMSQEGISSEGLVKKDTEVWSAGSDGPRLDV